MRHLGILGLLWLGACSPPQQSPLDLGSVPRDDAGLDAGLADAEDLGVVDSGLLEDAGPTVDAGFDPCGVSPVAAPATVGASPELATIERSGETECRRSYLLSTTATLRDPRRGTSRTFGEEEGAPRLRSGSLAWDGLYALALAEAKEASVARIQDGAFAGGAPVDCAAPGCFETGRLWHWVWTRDLAYAADLGLAGLDPARVRSSLEFKLSTRRGGGDLQVVQDTGTGGSYPVSTDRVVWALGARALLAELRGAERSAFRDQMITALRNTANHDRAIALDPSDGLYRGESSFLDWREQSYPPWTATDPVQIGASKALSTNVLHLVLLETLSGLLGEVQDPEASTWAGRAAALRSAIPAHFIQGDRAAAFLPSRLDPAAVEREDALALSLLVLEGLAPNGAALIASYPQLPLGPPVIWPAQRNVPIYHNRAIWPFVTAYLVRAAAQVRNDQVVTLGARSLIRGAALQMSHVENLEMTTGHAFVIDGVNSGPVVHSERQLWSIAGFLALVEQVLLGKELGPQGVRFRPYLTRALRAELGDRVVLSGLRLQGATVQVELKLPPITADRAGAYALGPVRLNGVAIAGAWIPPADLDGGILEIELLDAPEASAAMRLVEDFGAESIYGPVPPAVGAITATPGGLRVPLTLAGEDPARVTLEIYRDGRRVAQDLAGDSGEWIDPSASAASASYCYVAQARYRSSGNVSQRTPASCWWGSNFERIQSWTAEAFTAVGGSYVFNHGRNHYEAWGDDGHQLVLPSFVPRGSGRHLLQVVAGNGSGPISTGITAAVKRIRVEELPSGAPIAEGYLLMPQLGDWAEWRESSFVEAELRADRSYRVVIDGDDQSVNMSSFEHYARYTAGTGGATPFDRVNIAELKLLRLDP